MSRIVMKFGGTSLANVDRIVHASQHVAREITAGHQVAVVVSAMSGTTAQLLNWVQEVGEKASIAVEKQNPGFLRKKDQTALEDTSAGSAEGDVVGSAGEQITSGLMTVALQSAGISSRSWLGWQIPVFTDEHHGSAHIDEYNASELITQLEKGVCPVVAGFQGITRHKRITVLGRGGSDLSAVALAVALNADRCDIYTDVDGVYTGDPREVDNPQRISRISFETMLELASAGSKVIQARAVRLARAKSMTLRVRSTFDDPHSEQDEFAVGTTICHKEKLMERLAVNAITCDHAQAQITMRQVHDRPGIAANVFGPLGEAGVFVDMIAQSISADNSTDISFTVSPAHLDCALQVLNRHKESIGHKHMLHSGDVSKVTVVGDGMLIYAGVVGKIFSVLARENINLLIITTSEIRVSMLVANSDAKRAVACLHKAFELEDTPKPE